MVIGAVARFGQDTPSVRIIRHEAQHGVDIASVGALPFYLSYGVDWFTNGRSYEEISWEQRAEYVEAGGTHKGYADQITDWLWGWP
jgi:hypothetical protein